MKIPRFLSVLGLYAAWCLAGLLAAVPLTILFAWCTDPHGTGPVGEGIGFLMFFVFAATVGIVLGGLRASILTAKRWPQSNK